MKVFYHRDPDGMASAAIVSRYAKDFYPGDKVEYIGMNYSMDFPLDTIKRGETVFILDFSISDITVFDKLTNITKDIIWIDHHKSSIEKYDGYDIAGLQFDGTAACELTWEWCFPDQVIPKVVRLIGDYDLWKFKYGEESRIFNVATRLYDIRPSSKIWDKWLDYSYNPKIELEQGVIAIKYRNSYYSSIVRNWSYETTMDGYSAIACNIPSVSSELFDSMKKKYDLMIVYNFNGNLYSVSLYTQDPGIDVSEIAKQYGGGGHKSAAGFITKKLPFK